MTTTIDALVEALENILSVERTAINDSDAWTEIKVTARAALALARAEQAEPLSDDEIWKFWWNRPEVAEGEDDSMEAEFVAACRAAIAAHNAKLGGMAEAEAIQLKDERRDKVDQTGNRT